MTGSNGYGSYAMIWLQDTSTGKWIAGPWHNVSNYLGGYYFVVRDLPEARAALQVLRQAAAGRRPPCP